MNRKSGSSITWWLWQCFQPMKNVMYMPGFWDAKPKWLQINWKISWMTWVTVSALGLFGTKAKRELLFGCWCRWPCGKHTINCCNCGMISQVDRFLSLSFCKEWAHLPEVCRGIYIKKHITAPMSRHVSLHIYKHPQDVWNEVSTFHPSTRTHLSFNIIFVSFFFEILFRFSHFSFLSRHVCGFGHDVWVWLGNRGGNITPTWCLFHLLYFSEQMGTKQEEGRGLLTDNLIGMSLEDWKSPAREICCSNIKQQVRAEAAETLLSVERICQQKL